MSEGASDWAKNLDVRCAFVNAECDKVPMMFWGVFIPVEVRWFIAARATGGPDQAQRAVAMVAEASRIGEGISLDEARTVLGGLLNFCGGIITVAAIKGAVAGFYEMPVKWLDSPARSSSIVRPRQTAMYLCRKLTRKSYPEIGRRFGGKDHTTVMHAVKAITRLIAEVPEIASDVAQLEASLRPRRVAVVGVDARAEAVEAVT